MDRCEICKEHQYSYIDKKYLHLFSNCWDCDRKYWTEGSLSKEEFERREERALRETVDDLDRKLEAEIKLNDQ